MQPRGWNERKLDFRPHHYHHSDTYALSAFIIAMIVVGGVLLLIFWVWELKYASVPIMTKRIFFNRTFLLAMGIDFAYFFGGYLQLVYYSSYVYVVKDWTTTEWGYFNNELTVALCGGGEFSRSLCHSQALIFRRATCRRCHALAEALQERPAFRAHVAVYR